MRHAVSSELCAYWLQLRRGGCAPERSAIDPSAIRGALADTFVLEFDPAAGFPLRICGSNINALFLRELRGLGFLAIWRTADHSRIRAILEHAAEAEAPVCVQAEARPPGFAPVEIEVALFPLRHQGVTRARMLGSLAVVRSADWVGLIGSGPAALIGFQAMELKSTATRPASPTMALGKARGRRSSLFG